MDKKAFIGLILIGAVMFIWSKYYLPQPEDVEETKIEQTIDEPISDNIERNKVFDDTVAPSSDIVTNQIPDSLTKVKEIARNLEDYGIFYPSAVSSSVSTEKILIQNEKLLLTVNPKGGQIESVELKEYKTWLGEPLLLWDNRSSISFELPYENNTYLNTGDFYFEPQNTSFTVNGENNNELRMRLKTNDESKYIEYIYSLNGDSYEVDFDVEFHGLDKEIDLRRNDLEYRWNLVGLTNEKSKTFEDTKSTIFYQYIEEDRDYLSETKDDEIELDATLEWLAMKQYFFSAVAIPEEGFKHNRSKLSIKNLEDTTLTKEYHAELTLPIKDERVPRGSIKYFLGPNQYKVLKEYDNGMDRIIDLGWGIFGWMNKWLVIPVFNFLNKFIGSYGVIILLLTIFIKMLLFPLTYKNYLSSAKMKVMKPEIAEIGEKFKDDAAKKQQATMSLYRQSGVNPMAGCVPMLIQMPVLYAMFRFFPSSIELRQQPFLWAEDLSSYDSIMSIPKLPLVGDMLGTHLSLFTILMAISTILYTRMNSSQMPTGQPGMPNMKVMMYIFPVMMFFFFNSYPSGLSYYYLLANVISMAQMYVIKNYIIDEDKIRTQIAKNKKTPKKKSKFQQRLEDAQKQQKAGQKRRK